VEQPAPNSTCELVVSLHVQGTLFQVGAMPRCGWPPGSFCPPEDAMGGLQLVRVAVPLLPRLLWIGAAFTVLWEAHVPIGFRMHVKPWIGSLLAASVALACLLLLPRACWRTSAWERTWSVLMSAGLLVWSLLQALLALLAWLFSDSARHGRSGMALPLLAAATACALVYGCPTTWPGSLAAAALALGLVSGTLVKRSSRRLRAALLLMLLLEAAFNAGAYVAWASALGRGHGSWLAFPGMNGLQPLASVCVAAVALLARRQGRALPC
jgi:hypothetical protein